MTKAEIQALIKGPLREAMPEYGAHPQTHTIDLILWMLKHCRIMKPDRVSRWRQENRGGEEMVGLWWEGEWPIEEKPADAEGTGWEYCDPHGDIPEWHRPAEAKWQTLVLYVGLDSSLKDMLWGRGFVKDGKRHVLDQYRFDDIIYNTRWTLENIYAEDFVTELIFDEQFGRIGRRLDAKGGRKTKFGYNDGEGWPDVVVRRKRPEPKPIDIPWPCIYREWQGRHIRTDHRFFWDGAKLGGPEAILFLMFAEMGKAYSYFCYRDGCERVVRLESIKNKTATFSYGDDQTATLKLPAAPAGTHKQRQKQAIWGPLGEQLRANICADGPEMVMRGAEVSDVARFVYRFMPEQPLWNRLNIQDKWEARYPPDHVVHIPKQEPSMAHQKKPAIALPVRQPSLFG